MRTKQLVAASAVAAALLVVVAGCSSSNGTATATTSAVVKSSGESGGKSGGGSSDDGTSGGAGDTDAQSVALPADWPDELALPDGVVVIEATDISGHSWKVVGRVDGDPKATLDEVEANLDAADWNLEPSNFEDTPQGGYGGVSGQNRQKTVAITLGPDATGDTTQLTIYLADKTSE